MKICFNPGLQTEYEVIPLIIYKQYKDCRNNGLSKSKNYGGLTIKLCILEVQEHNIFSNFMPVTPKTSEYYMQFYSYDPTDSSLQTIYPFRMEKVSTNDSFEIKEYERELIVRSLFNFICYYELQSEIKWTLTMAEKFINATTNYEKTCNATVTLQNDNFVGKFNLTISNLDPAIDRSFMPWIPRGFFMVLALISLVQLRLYLKHKAIKMNKMKLNLLSNEFEFKVRLNSKKDISSEDICESTLTVT